ncbi:MAG: hypothetical protein HY974_02950 [Candidatus Kerfeldbacteria bacterium]|nr:hypothetical protein [Candidatus Kerfeldbacteria bacterium]
MPDDKLSEIQSRFLKEAQQKQRRIAIGIWRPEPVVVDSLRQAQNYTDLTVVGCQIEGLNCMPTKDDDEASHVIVDLVKEGRVEGFVRGQLKDSYTHKVYVEALGRPEPKFKFTPLTIAKDRQWFTISSPSNYNSLTLEQKQAEAERAARWLTDLGYIPKIGVASTRRLSGRVGEFGLLEEIAKYCEEAAEFLRGKGYDVTEYYIEYERAVWEGCNLIVPSIGMIANTWLKGLVYLGGWTLVCCPMLDEGSFYDDSPRNNVNWFWPIISTAAWINRSLL